MPTAYRLKRAGDSALHKLTGLGKVQPNDPIHLPVPVRGSMRGQSLSRFNAHPIVVHAKVGCVRVRDVDCNEWDLCSCDLVSDHGRDLVLYLKLDDEIHLTADELLGVPYRGRSVIAIVQNQQIYSHHGGRVLKALRHLDRERHVGALRWETKPH